MTLVSRLGNPLLSGFLNVLHRTNIRDVHCGMRALRRDVLPALNLRTVGMEFASEMVIRATREKLDVRELPIELQEHRPEPVRDGGGIEGGGCEHFVNQVNESAGPAAALSRVPRSSGTIHGMPRNPLEDVAALEDLRLVIRMGRRVR